MGLELRHRCHPFLSSRAERGDLGCHPFLSSRGTWRSRLFRASKQTKARLLRKLAMTDTSCQREHSTFVIERDEAISVVQGQQTDKSEIASQARNDRYKLSSRAQYFCHREGRSDLACHSFLSSRAKRGDLGCSGPANREKRDCFAGSQ